MDVLFRSPLGALMARPWVDRAGLIALRRWYFPLSRLWAAANAAGDDVARFRAEIGGPLPGLWAQPYLPALLSRNARLASAAGSARAAWETALFGDTAQSVDRLLLLDRERRLAATRHLANRALFYPLLFPRRPPPARWQIDRPDQVQCDLGPAIARPDGFYDVPVDATAISVSQPVVRGGLREYWLRAPTPAVRLSERPGCETLYARVVEPADGAAPATLIYGGGLCLEFELLTLARDPAARLAALGWRVVEPISPYHGLRAMPGRYGGEPFFAAGPTSSIDLIAGQAIESRCSSRGAAAGSPARWRWPAFR